MLYDLDSNASHTAFLYHVLVVPPIGTACTKPPDWESQIHGHFLGQLCIIRLGYHHAQEMTGEVYGSSLLNYSRALRPLYIGI